MPTTLSVHWLFQVNGRLADHRAILIYSVRLGESLAHRFKYRLAVHVCWLLVPASTPYPGLDGIDEHVCLWSAVIKSL